MARKQFTFYRSFLESIDSLPTKKEKLQAYEMLCRYALDRAQPDLNCVKPGAATVFLLAKPVLDTAHRRSQMVLKGSNHKQSAQ